MMRKNLPILIVLFSLAALKVALGQTVDDGVIAWDPNGCWDCQDDAHTVMAMMTLAPIFGVVICLIRAATQSRRLPVLEPLRLK